MKSASNSRLKTTDGWSRASVIEKREKGAGAGRKRFWAGLLDSGPVCSISAQGEGEWVSPREKEGKRAGLH